MPEHPFTFDYIGLGLLDDASIRRDRDGWAADYREAAGDPYLTVHVGPTRVRIEEFDAGRPVAVTIAPTITQAIGMHGADALGEERSRFWERVAALTPLAWVQTACPDARYSFIPAIGIGQLCLPLPADLDWRPPEPGPIARRIGQATFDDTFEVVPATLVRFIDRGRSSSRERIKVMKVAILGILVAEAVDALLEAHGPTRSVEWRPFVRSEPATRVAQLWHPRGEPSAEDEPDFAAFSIVEDAAGDSRVTAAC